MTFVRTGKDPDEPPDALDRFFALFRNAMRATGRPAGAVAPQAAALIRHVSAVTRAGGSRDAAAAIGLLSGPASGVLDLSDDEVERRISPRASTVMRACSPTFWHASTEQLEARLVEAEGGRDRDVAVLDLLSAEGAARHVLQGHGAIDDALRSKLDVVARRTAWLGPVVERDELAQHLASMDGANG